VGFLPPRFVLLNNVHILLAFFAYFVHFGETKVGSIVAAISIGVTSIAHRVLPMSMHKDVR